MLTLIRIVKVASLIVRTIIQYRKLLIPLAILAAPTELHASGLFWGPPKWVQELKQQSERQHQQTEQMAELQSHVTAGARDLVAADATARRDWIDLQNKIETTRSDLSAQQQAMLDAHSRLESERRVIASERSFDQLTSSSITAIGSILACLIPLLIVGWLMRNESQNEEPRLLLDQLLLEVANSSPHRFSNDPRCLAPHFLENGFPDSINADYDYLPSEENS